MVKDLFSISSHPWPVCFILSPKFNCLTKTLICEQEILQTLTLQIRLPWSPTPLPTPTTGEIIREKRTSSWWEGEDVKWISLRGDGLADPAVTDGWAVADSLQHIWHIRVGLSIPSWARADGFGQRGQRVFREKESMLSQVLVDNRLCSWGAAKTLLSHQNWVILQKQVEPRCKLFSRTFFPKHHLLPCVSFAPFLPFTPIPQHLIYRNDHSQRQGGKLDSLDKSVWALTGK